MNSNPEKYLISSKYYLPDFLKESNTMMAIIDCLDALISKQQPEFEKIHTSYIDGLYKTKDYTKLSQAAKLEVVKELGFGYLLDILPLTSEQLSSLLIFFNLIYILKGKKEGLMLCLKEVMGMNVTYIEWDEITEEYPHPRQEFTAILKVVGNDYENTDIFRKLKNFVRSYMLPWVDITVKLTIEGPITYVYPSGGVLSLLKQDRNKPYTYSITLENFAIYDDKPAYDLLKYGGAIYSKHMNEDTDDRKKCKFTISTKLSNAVITINNVVIPTLENTVEDITLFYAEFEDMVGNLIEYEITCEGYESHKNHIVLNSDKTLNIELKKL